MTVTSSLALITGASAGLGADYAHLFAADGHDVILVARRQDRLDTLAAELKEKYDVTAHVFAADLSQTDSATTIHAFAQSLDKPVAFLVNNAGFGTTGSFAQNPVQREVDMLRVNIESLVHLTGLFLPAMVENRFGRILNIGSTAGFQPGPNMATYYATKAFVNHFTEALSADLQGTGVTATVSCPGPTLTEFGEVSGNGKSALFQMTAASSDKVALHGYRAMMKGTPLAIYGLSNQLGVQSLRLAPRSLVRKVTQFLNQVPDSHPSND